MIERLFTTQFTVQRPEWTNDESILGSVDEFTGHLQQAQPEKAIQLGLMMTNTYTVWCSINTDVQTGDTLTTGNDTYSVKAVQINNYGSNQHKELILEKHATLDLPFGTSFSVNLSTLLFSIIPPTVAISEMGGGGGGPSP